MKPERPSPDSLPLFREDALAHHLGEAEEGELLQVSPSWTGWTYWFLFGIVAVGLAYLFLGRVSVYETGPAVLRVDGSIQVTSPMDGVIHAVEVVPGQLVTTGQILVRLSAEHEEAELAKIEREFELQLLARLRDPNDLVADRELRRLRPELERARAELDHRVISAPADGAVQDVRIDAGDFLAAGAPVLSLVPVEPEFNVIAFLPGHALPQLDLEMPVRLKISGYAYAHVATSVDSFGNQVIGPSEARRFLGSEIADVIELVGPVVVVRCRLTSDSFFSGKQEYRVHDGMRATAEVKVREERLLYRLVPGLKALDVNGA